jgi:hypothetical protein
VGFSPWRAAAGKSPPDTQLAVDHTNVLAFCQHVFLRSPLAANLMAGFTRAAMAAGSAALAAV